MDNIRWLFTDSRYYLIASRAFLKQQKNAVDDMVPHFAILAGASMGLLKVRM